MTWRPIETVKKNGKPILVYLETEMLGSRVHAATLKPNVSIVGGLFSFDAPKMTHWMPQPAAPETSGD